MLVLRFGMLINYFCLFLFQIFSNCGVNAKKNAILKSVNGIVVLINIPIIDNNGNLQFFSDSFNVLEIGDINIYETTYETFSEQILVDKSGKTIDSVADNKIMQKYFVHKKKRETGILYDSTDVNSGQKNQVEEYLKSILTINQERIITPRDSLVSVTIPNNRLLIEKYVRNQKKDHLDCDTVYLFFEKELEKIDFSFSPLLDSSRNKKLTKIVYFQKGYPLTGSGLSKFNRQITLQMKFKTFYKSENFFVFIDSIKDKLE